MKSVKQTLAVAGLVAGVLAGFAGLLPEQTGRVSLQELRLVRELKANPAVLAARSTYVSTSNNMYGSDGTTYVGTSNNFYGSDGTTYIGTGGNYYGSDGTTYIGTSNNLYGSNGSTTIGGGSVSFVEKVLRKGKLPSPVLALR
jgi:hypothetical protein